MSYHIVLWIPKYRFRILKNNVGKEVHRCINVYCNQLGCEVVELNVQVDRVYFVVKVPPKLSISKLMGYFVDSVGINEEIIRRYVRDLEKERVEQQ